MEKRNEKVLTTQLPIDYSVVFKHGMLEGIIEEGPEKMITYYFCPEKEQLKVTNDILENALKAMIGSNIAAFEILYVCFNKHEYQDIAIKVFKEHWNKLYNTSVADSIFEREISFERPNITYDFFAKNK